MTTDDLLISEAARGTIRYSDALRTYLHNDEVCPVYEAHQIHDLVLADRLVIDHPSGLVLPVGRYEVA